MLHLTPAQLTALRDGELHDRKAARHIASCAVCQANLAESRRLASLLQSASQAPSTAHPSEEILAAYFDNALPEDQSAAVDLHVNHCLRCSTVLQALRQLLPD